MGIQQYTAFAEAGRQIMYFLLGKTSGFVGRKLIFCIFIGKFRLLAWNKAA